MPHICNCLFQYYTTVLMSYLLKAFPNARCVCVRVCQLECRCILVLGKKNRIYGVSLRISTSGRCSPGRSSCLSSRRRRCCCLTRRTEIRSNPTSSTTDMIARVATRKNAENIFRKEKECQVVVKLENDYSNYIIQIILFYYFSILFSFTERFVNIFMFMA